MKSTVHEGSLFLVVECSLTVHFSTSFLDNLNIPGVARARSRRRTRAGMTAPPGGDQEDQREESRSASGWPGSPGDRSRDLPHSAKQSRRVLSLLGLAGTHKSGRLCFLWWVPGLLLGTLASVLGTLGCELRGMGLFGKGK